MIYNIFAYLRSNNITDYTRFSLFNGNLTRWNYNIPQPNLNSIENANDVEVFNDTERMRSRVVDIYSGERVNVPVTDLTNYYQVNFTPLRDPVCDSSISPNGEEFTLSSGFWRLEFFCETASPGILRLRKSVDDTLLCTVPFGGAYVTVTRFLKTINPVSFKIGVKYNPGTTNFGNRFNLLIERI